MSDPAMKRFWKTADVAAVAGGWGVMLDARPLRTPAKALWRGPNQAVAAAAAAEWNAQGAHVVPAAMPVTRYVNSAIDRVAPRHGETAEQIAKYGETDLLCYRAAFPEDLAGRQKEVWDPVLDWLAETYGARLAVCAGVSPTAQPAAALAALSAAVRAESPEVLAALWDCVGITGSLALGLALRRGWMTTEAVLAASRVDEAFQIARWGEDAEAQAAAARRRRDLEDAAAFLALLEASAA